MLEKWKDGNYRNILRDEKGHFLKGSSFEIVKPTEIDLTKFYGGNVTVLPKKKELYRACVFLDGVPINHDYHHFGIVVIDTYDNIDMDELEAKLISYITDEIGFGQGEWWFSGLAFGKQYPEKNYTSVGVGEWYEHTIL